MTKIKKPIGRIPIDKYQHDVDEFIEETRENYPALDSLKLVENPEFIQIVTDDDEDKVLEGIRKDGTKIFGYNVKVNKDLNVAGHVSSKNLNVDGDITSNGSIEQAGCFIYTVNHHEYLNLLVDQNNGIIFGVRKNGDIVFGAGVPTQIQEKILSVVREELSFFTETFFEISTEEYLSAEEDAEGKVLGGRRYNGKRFESVGFETPEIEVGGTKAGCISDPEGRSEALTDEEGKIISYRKKDGTKVENVGFETPSFKAGSIECDSLILPDDSLEQVDEHIDSKVALKKYYLPKFGAVNIKEEVFYLTADLRYSDKSGVVLIQMLDDDWENARARRTLSYYYIKSTLTPNPDGTYDRNSVNENSVQLELHAGKDVTAIGDKYFATNVYTPVIDASGYITDYTKVKASKVTDPETGEIIGYEVDGVSTEVTQIKDVPPYKAWKVNKNIEHYCVADVDFGAFYTKNNVPCSIKYQGAGSTAMSKKGLRFTFYKKNDYKKKDKVKIGEFVRLSGFNMKSYALSPHRVNDPVISNLLIEMWESRGKDCYPWNKDSVIYNGATGFIKSFPIQTYWGDEFYGLQFFSLKKDEKNYMLDGDDDASGCFLQGVGPYSGMLDPVYWDDEMGVDGRTLEYPDNPDSVSVETAAALRVLFKYIQGFIDGTIEIEGETVPFENSMLEERFDIASAIDYWITLEIFLLYDSVYNNVIMHSRADKEKFYLFFYDLDGSLKTSIYGYDITPDTKFMDVCKRDPFYMNMSFWEKLIDEYKDSIINRYADLRKTVLSDKNIDSVYYSYIDGIPQEVISKEVSRWGAGDPRGFIQELAFLKERLAVLDDTYLNI